MIRSEAHPRILCRCLGISSPRIFAAIRDKNLRTVEEVTRATRAGSSCGTCHGEIEEILADVYGQPVSPETRLENQLLCESETQIRVEATVENLVQSRLFEHNVRIKRFAIAGLTLTLQLDGAIESALCDELTEALQTHLCRDLEVRFCFEPQKSLS